MTPTTLTDAAWERLLTSSNEFTCYSAAMATWLAPEDEDWAATVSPGLWLRMTEEPGGLFGFAYFPPDLRRRLGLVRTGDDDAAGALEGVLAELERSGRVIVAADGFHLPWHVAHGRVHAPHWFLLTGSPDELEIADPFACRNELGNQVAVRREVSRTELEAMLEALPGDNPVHGLREVLAFGDLAPEHCQHRHQWFVRADVAATHEPDGADGPEAIRLLATHFRDRGQDPEAYSQADDIWSIARHRAFLHRLLEARAAAAGDGAVAELAQEHTAPLAKRWGHIAPLIMQATLSLRAGRPASSSVPDTLERLAEMESAAALAAAQSSITI